MLNQTTKVVVALVTFVTLVKASHPDVCNQTLGLESGDIRDQDLAASSSFDDHSTGPHNARLNQDRLGGAWCPKEAIQKGVKEWLQVTLKHVHLITGIVTQGRYGKGTGQEYLKHFMVEYRRPGIHSEWRVYSDKEANQIFNGSHDTITPVYQAFNPPIFASQIRVIPFSEHPRIVCLRLELHGCLDTSSLMAYSSPPPDMLGSSNISQSDSWWEEQSHGILTDGSFGVQDIKLKSVPSYDDGWMSWKRKGMAKPVELIFKFDSPRNFSKVNIFASNLFHLDVQVFKRAVVWFSIGGEYYITEPITYEYMPDHILEEPRNVSVRVKGNVGRFVKIQLYFSHVWMSVSEVAFDSFTAKGSFRQELPPPATPRLVATTDVYQPVSSITEDISQEDERALEQSTNVIEVEVLIGILTAVTFLLLLLFVAILLYSRRQKFLNSPTTRSLNPFPVQINMKDLLTSSPIMSGSSHSPNNHHLMTMNNDVSEHQQQQMNTTAFYEQGPFDHDLEECRSKWHSTGHVADPMMAPRGFRSSLNSAANITANPLCGEYASVDIQNINSGTVNGGSHYRSLQGPPPPPPPPLPSMQNQPQQPRSTAMYNLGNYFPRINSEPPTRKSYHTAPRDRELKPLPMAETLWNVTTTVQAICKQQQQPTPLAEIPRNNLRLKETFGRGCLGEVLLCEVDSDYSNVAQPVAVRSGPLHSGGSHDALDRQDFLRECRLLGTLRHPNVVRLVGVTVSEEPYCSVLEHSSHGDLYNYLRQMSRVVSKSGNAPAGAPGSTSTTASTSSSSGCGSASPMLNSANNTIQYTKLLDMAAQISTGMKYLESRNIVHKDLAARNCLLCDNNTVKITDVAMGISLFNSDYSEVRGRSCAPIRWQPWETLLLGRLTTHSNVWSFGITVWELLTLCRQRPFALLTDIEVIQNAEHAYYNAGLQVELVQPDHCEKDVWELLEECWNRDDKLRPSFAEINMFLKRKSLSRET